MSVLSHGEDYVLTFPSAYGRSILTTPWVELGGAAKISCPQTGYNTTIEFKTKSVLWGTEQNKIVAEIFPPNGKKNLLKVSLNTYILTSRAAITDLTCPDCLIQTMT